MSGAAPELYRIAGTYATLASGFDFPRQEFWAAVEGHRLRDLVAADGEASGDAEVPDDLAFPVLAAEGREREYLDVFELGRLHPYEGTLVASAGRDGIFEELLRFYHFFDLKLRDGNRDHPDHIVTELEFMSHLVGLEAMAAARGLGLAALRRAQRDFLSRHVLQWSGCLTQRLDTGAHASYALLAAWLDGFAHWHKSYLDDLLGEEAADMRERGKVRGAGGE